MTNCNRSSVEACGLLRRALGNTACKIMVNELKMSVKWGVIQTLDWYLQENGMQYGW